MNSKLSQWQLFLMVINFIIGSSFLFVPSLTSKFAYTDAWLSTLLATGVGLLFNMGWIYLLSRYDYASIYEIFDRVLGKWLGSLVTVAIVFFSIHLTALVVRNVSDYMVDVVMPETNPWIFQLVMLALAMYSASKGVGNIGKLNEVLSPLLFFLFYGSLLLVLNQFTLNNMQPVFAKGLFPIWHGTYVTLGFPFFELILIGSFFTFINQKRHVSRTFLLAILIGGLSLVIEVVVTLGVQGVYIVRRDLYPGISLLRELTVSPVFERMEAFISSVWIFTVYIKITIGFLASILGLAHLQKRKGAHKGEYGPFILPVALLIWGLVNQLHPNRPSHIAFSIKDWTSYTFTLFVIVTAVFVWGIVRKKHKQRSNE
ncbi:GerAB/ArcD/ProY family transporter [Numidum massiliense]|uniref:GerAB/ArcD/ProY family transporter n=1 Tax=Numidum massiliense TaxID=1522315 RepID=UPI0006D59986|nr:GerAB/ArcD/ProY family transporter [Numidum massiliense]